MLLIDNVDSFTFNIADLLHRVLGEAPTVWHHNHCADDLSGFDAVVVGPGPGRPQHATDLGLSALALRQRDVPTLGICLGHQGMAHLAGDLVTELGEPMHGRLSEVVHDGTGLFEGLPSPFRAVRYHSLEVRLGPTSPLVVTARAADDGVVMALSHTAARSWGVQFHPESVLSEHGERLIANFLRMAGVRHRVPADRVVDRRSVAIGDVHQPLPTETSLARPVRVETVLLGPAPDAWALHQALHADSPTSFWLDASGASAPQPGRVSGTVARPTATSSDSDSALFEPTAVGSKRANLLQDEPGDATGLGRSARCSVMGDASGPLSYVLVHRTGLDGVGAVTELSTGERLEGPLLPNLAALRDRLQMTGSEDLPGTFRPGFVGYLGYELKAELGGSAAHASPHPDARLVLADRVLVIDHVEGVAHAVYLWDDEVRAAQEAWAAEVRAVSAWLLRPPRAGWDGASPDGPGTTGPVAGPAASRQEATFRHAESAYLDLITQCQQEIRAGESYEICLTNAATWPAPVDEVRLAQAMREASPVPFAAWLRGPGPTVLSASPERFVSVTADGTVEARPIKGTRPRGGDQSTDAALAEELRTSVKERAENLMIVDLLRNDLHGVCRSGSVHVPTLFEVESFATVHQLVSTVRGELADGMDCLDVIGTCFPGGSMTGAPKVRTMTILDRLEGGPRGVYSGALGWIGLDGAMDLSIVIRTVTLTDGVAAFGVGGAITALSDPGEEYAETQVKAAALTSALRAATLRREPDAAR